jgi:hypothetical protein
MTTLMFRRLVTAALGLALMTSAAAEPLLVGQEKSSKKAKATAKGRLPAYYKDVVTEKQKTDIYALQLKYNGQIEALEQQLNTLQEQRDTEIEGLLSTEQKEKVEALRAAAAGKRKTKGASESTSTENTSAAEAAKPAAANATTKAAR